MSISIGYRYRQKFWYRCIPVAVIDLRVIPRKYTDMPPLKWPNSVFLANVLKRIIKNNFPIFLHFFILTKISFLSFWDLDFLTKDVHEKFSFAPISFKLGSAYVSEDSKKIKNEIAKISKIYFWQFYFFFWIFFS